MLTVPNQKIVTTNGAQHDQNNIYAKISVEAMEKAMVLLKASTFKLWCYMAKNQNNYTFALSCVDACRFCKMSSKTFHEGVKELQEVGYLVPDGGNHYQFYEMLPDMPNEISVTVNKSEEFSF